MKKKTTFNVILYNSFTLKLRFPGYVLSLHPQTEYCPPSHIIIADVMDTNNVVFFFPQKKTVQTHLMLDSFEVEKESRICLLRYVCTHKVNAILLYGVQFEGNKFTQLPFL